MTISFDEFKKAELKVAEIKNVEDIDGADKLYKLEVDVGSEKRTLVAGIKNAYKKEELIGKKIVVVTNLEPAKIRGITSHGMLLAATKDGNVSLLTIDKKIENGANIS